METRLVLLTLLLLTTAGNSMSQETGPPNHEQTFDLRALKEFSDPARQWKDEEKMQKLLGYLRSELKNPSQTARGLGGDITSNYILEQMVLTMAACVPQDTINKFRSAESDPIARNCLIVGWCLSMKKRPPDTEFQALSGILAEDKQPTFLRSLCSRILFEYPAPTAIPALAVGLRSTFAIDHMSCIGPPQSKTVWPIRGYCKGALLKLEVEVVESRDGSLTVGHASLNRRLLPLLDLNSEQSIVAIDVLSKCGDSASATMLEGFLLKWDKDPKCKELARKAAEAIRAIQVRSSGK